MNWVAKGARLQAAPLASIAATLRAVALIAGAGLLLWMLGNLVLDLFCVVLLALLLRGLAELLSRLTRLPVGLSLAVVTIGIVVLVGLLIAYRGPRFVSELRSVYSQIVPEIEKLRQRYAGTTLGSLIDKGHSKGGGGSASGTLAKVRAFSLLGDTVHDLGTAFVVLLAAIYVAASPGIYIAGVVRLFPLPARERVREVFGHCGRTLQWWMVGQGVAMLAVWILSTAGLYALNVPLPFALGALAGLLTFIPYFGAWLSAVPAILMALTVSLYTALWTIGVFLICHLVEGYLLAPVVARRTVELPPGLTLLAILLGGAFYGSLGLMLATPLAAAIMVAVQEGYVASVLGDEEMRAREHKWEEGRPSSP